MAKQITPFLWFDDQAEEATNFYVSLFADGAVLEMHRTGEPGPENDGAVITTRFRLAGQEFMALNGGPNPDFPRSGVVSFFITCESQAEVDRLWEALSEGGATSRCGWLTDKFGVFWQVIPSKLGELLADPDPERANRVMQAMLQMTKIDIATLQRAYDQE